MGVSENGGTLFGGPYNKDPTIFGSPILGNSHIRDPNKDPQGFLVRFLH